MSQMVISWSAIRAYEECKQKALLLRSGKKSPGQDIRNYFHGTVVDRVMREWLLDPEAKSGDMEKMVRDIMDREELEAITSGDGVVRWRTRTDREEVIQFCIELVRRLEPILLDLVVPYEYEVAKRFKAPIEIPYLNGMPTIVYLAGEIDLLIRKQVDPPWWEVWDLKGTKDNSYWRKTIGQLVFYDVSVYASFSAYTRATGLIQPMCDQRVLPVEVTDQARQELMQRIIKFAHSMWAKEMPPRDDEKYCDYCPVRHACPKFQPAQASSNLLTLSAMRARLLEAAAPDLLSREA